MPVCPKDGFGDETKEQQLNSLCINTIRTLSMDAVQKANSGHPGTPMALAPLAYTLWTRYLRHNPAQSALAGPRPLHSVQRPRLHAALFHVVPDRLRSFARRHQAVPAVGIEDSGPS